MNEIILTKISITAVALGAVLSAADVLSILQGTAYCVAITSGVLAISKHFKKDKQEP
jgi:hypothetical protein